MAPRILDVPLDTLRRERTSIKWRRYGDDVLPLWIAEMDARPCPAVVEAVTAAMTRGDTGYAGDEGYAAALAELAAAEWGWAPAPGSMVRVTDVLTGIAHLTRLLTEPGGPVVVSPPVYNAFYDVIASIERQVVEAPLTAEGRLDLDLLDTTFAERDRGRPAGGIPALQPAQPDGHRAHGRRARRRWRRSRRGTGCGCSPTRSTLRSSTRRARFTPYLTVPGSERGITVTSGSKAWNLAGLKAALVVPGGDARADVARLHPFVTFGASHFGVIAQTAAYRDGRAWVHQLVDELDANRALLADLVREQLPGARLLLPESTYLAWLDLRPLGLGDHPGATLLERGRVAVSDGTTFGSSRCGSRAHQLRHLARHPARGRGPHRELR